MKVRSIILISLFSLFLSACGSSTDSSGSADGTVAEGGIGGTGISTGPLTGFGSVFVNGVEFEVDSAEFSRDGDSSFAENDFSIGEYITVVGTINADGLTGTASKVIFEDIIEGVVTAATTDNASLEVLGQKVIVDKLTVFIGFKLLDELIVGNVVEVSGFRNKQGEIVASGIKRKQDAFINGETGLEINGTVQSISASAQTFNMNGLIVDYSQASFENIPGNTLVPGLIVEVKSSENISANTISASSIEGKNELFEVEENTEFEIEGLVSEFNFSHSFSVNGQPVIANSDTEFKYGAQDKLALNVKVEVEGVVNASGVLVAEEISVRESSETIELEGLVQTLSSSAGKFSVLNNLIVTNTSTIFIDESSDNNTRLSINDLALGNRVKVKGNILSNGNILATRVDRENEIEGEENEETEIEGIPENINASGSNFSLLGVTVSVNASTEFEADDDEDFTEEEFFQFISSNPGIQIKVEGDLIDGVVVARKIEIDD